MPAISTLAGTHGYGRGKSQTGGTVLPYVEVGDPSSNRSQWLVKYTTDGNILWRALISGAGGATLAASALVPTANSASDSAGNIYVVGYFANIVVVFYNSDGGIAGTLSNAGFDDAFLVKYNRSGIVQWFTQIVRGGGSEYVNHITTDSTGNILLGGSFSGTAVFLDTTGIAYRQFTSSGAGDAFVAKLNSNGIFQWIAILSGTSASNNDIIGGIVTDPSGNVYATCNYTGGDLTTFNGATSTSNLVAVGTALANFGISVAIIKYNSSGVIQWRSRFGSSGGGIIQNVTNLVADSTFTNFYASFSYTGTISMHDASNTLRVTGGNSFGNVESALVKYNSDGTPIWFVRNLTVSNDSSQNTAVDTNNNVYLLTTQANVSTLFNANDSSSFANSVPGGQFVIKYNPSGTVQWLGRFANTVLTGFMIDSSNNLYISLYSTSQFTYTSPNGIITNGPLFYGTTNDMALVKLNSDGNFVWYARIVSTNQRELSMSVSSDSLGNMIVMGTLAAAASYPNSTLLYNADGSVFTELPPAMHTTSDVFVARYTTLGVGSWASRLGSLNGVTSSRFVASHAGGVYVVGQYSGVPLFADGGTAGVRKTITDIGTAPDHFLARYNAVGQSEWIVRISTSTTTEVISNISTDSSGNVYVGIYFRGTIIFYGSDNNFITITPPNPHIIVIKYNPQGIIQWYVRMTNSFSGGSQFRFTLSVDSSDNLIVAGLYEGTDFRFGNSDQSSFGTTLTNSGGPDGFLVKYNSSGFVTWVTKYQNTGGEFGTQVDTDSSGNIYLAGEFTGTVLFFNASAPNGASVASLAIQQNPDAFVVKYNSSGTYQWAYRFGGNGSEISTGIAADNSGNSYMIATYTATASLFPVPSPSFSLPAAVGTDIVIIKYNTAGTAQWIVRLTGAGIEVAGNIACDKATGTVFFVGQMGQSAVSIIDASGNTARVLTPDSANNDGFVAAVNTNGSLVWAVRTSEIAAENITGINVDSLTNSVVVTGTYMLTGTWACSVGY